ncbi:MULTISPECIES: metal-dependent transcriptional regulator [Tissierellales]|jgi:Mn-dependent DtxR family transcriptional regulator|uniref:Metal-dependent transcriptional regulator n=1 Tax=Acidilutibacter cellobiosedens TaxID=2507161 RepID=A0A410Q8B7_9FIRM|nr:MULTISPECIES: metal-dependent transcriptional regulator [Tissierellales]MBE6082376.1 metal-dependent transcriptional regulator [Tissierellaceae bacterium]QAT60230.1 metal-dependent transcriptional regulator [Acidilutibacter cellobiosedens]SCL92745.1 Manganese transport regulator [Sporanaerobacter sp. PP17-6a]
MKIQESAENYLETILILQQRNGQVRSIDIVNEMNFKKSSISVAMKHFRENGYICMDEDGYITLTESGLAIAEHIYERHRTLTKYFMALGVSEKNAKKDACKIEHDISEESFNKIREHLSKLQQ